MILSTRARVLLVAVPSLLCGACATSDGTSGIHAAAGKPPNELPAAFENRADGPSLWPSKEWYAAFGSDELNSLIDRAEKNNLDLIAAQARVRQADARARAAGAALLPQVDIGGTIAHVRGRSGGESARETDWSALVSASYEVDFWGRNRATANSARSLAVAGKADRDTVAL